MAGNMSDESGVGKSVEGISSGQRCQSGEALAEWRSSEQVENGVPSTSPPYWDTDDDDDCGPKPSELYGKNTWKIEKFSQTNKRELRSNAFEVGGYKWYILIYPQGCDVCNHLSLFLCVANHDKLLPGWSHFAQFTIAVVNKDPKKSKYSDTLHRFWKKEHDWGWKKFMELTKVYDGFVDAADNLIIKAQVQVIREKADRPFRCLDCQYRRELVRVYLTNVEQICRRFVEERRAKLGNLIEDKARWTSFCAFWRGIDQHSRRRMSRENMDVILKVVVKHFFIEKEVTSTLVMDSLYSGLKALESQSRGKKSRAKFLDIESMPAPIIGMENDMFALMDDVLPLLERAAVEPLPPKDEKGPQNRTKDGNSGEDLNKDSIERDERRLTELGRRTVEIFVLAHIFSNKIEVAYQEAVALKRQEELIREEEAGQAESDQKAKRGASEKDKKSKKKQGKQKRNKKSKDKGREERPVMVAQDKHEEGNPNDDKMDSSMDEVQNLVEKPDIVDDVSDASDSVDGVTEVLQLDSEDRDASPVNWDTETSEVHHTVEASSSNIGCISSSKNGVVDKKSNFIVDDSSSTCSTDSLPSVTMNGLPKGNSSPNYKGQKSPRRGKSQQGKVTCDERNSLNEAESQLRGTIRDLGDQNDGSTSSKFVESESDSNLQDQSKCPDMDSRKAEELVLLQKKLSIKDNDNSEGPVARDGLPKEKISAVSPGSSPTNLPSTNEAKFNISSCLVNPVPLWKPSPNGSEQNDKDASSALVSSSHATFVSKPFGSHTSTTRLSEKVIAQQVPVMSRPSTAPLAPSPRPAAPVVSMVQTVPALARSVSAAGRLGPDASASTSGYVPQSYRNAIVGNPVASNSSSFTHATSSSSLINASAAYTQQPSSLSSMLSQSSERQDSNTGQSALAFGILARDTVENGPQWIKSSQREASRNLLYDSPRINDVQNLELYKPADNRSQENLTTDFLACTSRRQTPGLLAEEFPHLDIINDLLDDEHGSGVAARTNSFFQDVSNRPQLLNRQFTFPGEMGTSSDVGHSTNSCRYERSQSYHDDGFQQPYSSSSSVFDSLRDYIPHPSPLPYVNGQVDGFIHNQWQMAGSDLSYLGLRSTETDAYQYYSPDYLNMTCGVNGYTIFRPSNGH